MPIVVMVLLLLVITILLVIADKLLVSYGECTISINYLQLFFPQPFDCFVNRHSARSCGGVRNLIPQRIPPDIISVPPGFATDRSINYQLDLCIFYRIDYVGPSHGNFVYAFIGNTVFC